jgi:hypothetical protein
MISSVSNSSPVNNLHAQQTQSNKHAEKAKKEEPQDSVVLSKQAKAAGADRDHDGD